jgi:hypothetical protein
MYFFIIIIIINARQKKKPQEGIEAINALNKALKD